MKLLLDTNAYSDFMRGDPSRVEIIRGAANILMPLIVLAELRAGFAGGNQEQKNAAILQKFLSSPRVGILVPDEQTTFHYAQIWTQLRHKGASIPTNDVWIASLAVQHGLPLCTSDKHFAHIPQLPLL